MVQLRRMEERKGDQRNECQNPKRPHRMLLEINNHRRPYEPSYPEEEVQQLYPEVLAHSNEQLKHAEIAENVHHAASGSSYKHSDSQVEEAEVHRADYQRTSTYYYQEGEESMIGEVLGQVCH